MLCGVGWQRRLCSGGVGLAAPHCGWRAGALGRNQYILVGFAAGALSAEVGLLAGLSLANASFAIAISRVSAKVRKGLDDVGLSLDVSMQEAHDLFPALPLRYPLEMSCWRKLQLWTM